MPGDRTPRVPSRRLGLLAALGATRSAEAQSIDDLLTRKTLRVGILADLPPFGVATVEHKYEGYDVDVAELMAKYLGVELELVPVTGPNRIPYLLTSRIDVLIATFGITPERARQVAFSIPYSSIDIVLLAARATRITSTDDLKALKVGVTRASTPDTALTAIAPPGTRIMRFDDEAMTNQAMLSGQIDTLALSTTTVRAFLALNPSLDYETKFALRHQPNGIALRRRQADLMQWINTFIYYVKNNGELDAICRKWIGTPLPEMPVF